ncbi:MAG: hypothetical protein ACRD1E_12270 [Terriglobales bacterium]
MAALITSHFVPVRLNIKLQAAGFHRFGVLWTPTTLVLDSAGAEQFRLEGYLPRAEFSAQLELGRARLAFVQKRWQAAEEIYEAVVRNSASTLAAAAGIYWGTVCYYKRTQDHTRLRSMAERLLQEYPASLEAKKAGAFLPPA